MVISFEFKLKNQREEMINSIGDGMTDDTVIGDNQLGDKTESQRLYSNYAQVTV